jgi:hypothetical protein
VIIPELVWEGPPQKPDTLASQYLLFTSSFDGPTDSYIEALRTSARDQLDAIWSNCAGYPGIDDGGAFARYLLHNHIPSEFFVTAYAHLSLPEVRSTLDLRKRMIAFAGDHQALPDDELQSAFLNAFPEDPGHWEVAAS